MVHNPEQSPVSPELNADALLGLTKAVYRVERFLNDEPMHDGDDQLIPDYQREDHYQIALRTIDDLAEGIRGRSFILKIRESGESIRFDGIREIIRSYEDKHLAVTFGFEGVAQSLSLHRLGKEIDIEFV